MKNSTGRKLLEERYGKGCFMERAGIRKITPEQEEKYKKIFGFKKLDRTISYHHIKERSKGGEVSVENGANIAVYNHQWLHRQPPEVIDSINKRLQEFKLSIDIAEMRIDEKGIEARRIAMSDFCCDSYIEIPIYENTEKDEMRRKEKFNRAKVKRDTEKIIEEELYK